MTKAQKAQKALKARRSAAAKKGWETRTARERREIEAENAPRPQVYPSPPFVLIHRDCGKPAFGLIERPVYGALARSEIARHLDGSPMEPNAPMVCESCGGQIWMPRSIDVVDAATGARPDPDALDTQEVVAWLAKQNPNPWAGIADAVSRGKARVLGWFR